MATSRAIETERLRILPFAAEFLSDRYIAWLNDPEVVRYSEQRHRMHDLSSCRAYWLSFEGTPHYFWAVLTRDPVARHIGNASAYVDIPNSVADLAILVGDREIWGKGFGSEIWQALCRFLLVEANLRKVTAGTMAVNDGMLGVMRKSGMIIEGRRHRQFLFEGREVDLVQAALFRPPTDG
jgi:RimJ/RimL family protein N-acetyltransferase